MTDLLESAEPTAEQREYLGIIHDSADSLLSMIGEIRDFAAKSNPSRLNSRDAFSLAELAREELHQVSVCSNHQLARLLTVAGPECAACLRICAIRNNLSLVFDNQLKRQGRYVGDSSELRNTIRALVDNAVKFTRQGEAVVTLSSRGRSRRAEFVNISIRDTGIGIPSALHEAIFEPFNQADVSNSRTFGGAGIGLSLAREAIRSLGGQVTVQSAPGCGSTFTIEVALARETVSEAELSAA